MEIKFADSFWESYETLLSPLGRSKTWVYYNNPFRKARQIWQRGTRGYATEDLWNLKDHLGFVIYNSVKAFRDLDKVGIPTDLSDNGITQEEQEKVRNGKLDDIYNGFYEMVHWDDTMEEVTIKHKKTATGPEREFFGHNLGRDFGTDEERKAWADEYDARFEQCKKRMEGLATHIWGMWD
jgi:hypothetical protein